MSRSYAEIQAEIDRLQREATAARTAEVSAVIQDIREKMAAYGLTVDDLRTATRARGPVAPKYRNPSTGETWSGRGRTPRWLVEAEAAGKSRARFTIKAKKG